MAEDHMIAGSYVYDLICERANEWKQARKLANERGMTGSRPGSIIPFSTRLQTHELYA